MESMRQVREALTPTEFDVYELLARGFCLKEIAQKRKRSIHTVSDQLHHVMHKMGIHSQSGLVGAYWYLTTQEMSLFGLKDAEAVYEEAGHQIWQSMLKDDGRPDYWQGTPHRIDCGCSYCT